MSHSSGFVAPGFEAVREAFEHNFSERREVGAAFAAVRDGTLVVDLWGGFADMRERRPWAENTLQILFSGTKGLVALCMLILVDRNQLDLEAAVARYWPEFGQAGKARISVQDVLSHRARLPGIRVSVGLDDLLDGNRMAVLLAEQEPERDPRAEFAYHGLTFGWLCNELMRRIDGRSVGKFFSDEVAERLGLELWLGLPAELEERVATSQLSADWQGLDAPIDRDDFLWLVLGNPPQWRYDPVHFPWNRTDWRRAEIPGANAIGTARSVARLYGCLARGGEIDGVRLVGSASLRRAISPHSAGFDFVHGRAMAFGHGFMVQSQPRWFGPRADAFGHPGAGGSTHGAWPAHRASFSYLPAELRNSETPDPRVDSLLKVLNDALTDPGAHRRQFRP